MSNKYVPKKNFYINGIWYKSFAAYCREMNIPETTVYKIKRVEACTLAEAVEIWREKKAVQNKHHGNIKKICALYGIPYQSLLMQYDGDVEAFIQEKILKGQILPERIDWNREEFKVINSKEYSMNALNIVPEISTNQRGDLLFLFSDINDVPFKIQYQVEGIWLFEIGPLPFSLGTSKEEVCVELNRNSWLGCWIVDSDNIYCRFTQIGKKVLWKDIIKIISYISRICRKLQ